VVPTLDLHVQRSVGPRGAMLRQVRSGPFTAIDVAN
jgi:hypothetical protein